MTVNEALQDAETSHQVDLQRYSNGVVRRMSALLARTDSDLFAQLTLALNNLPPGSFTVERLDAMLGSVRQLNLQAYLQLERELTAELREFAAYESGFQLRLFEAIIPAQIQVHVAIAPVAAEQVFAAAYAQPFRGRLLREWASSLGADKAQRIRDTLRIGFVEQQTIQQMVQRVRGTRAKGYSDGIIEVDRRNAEAVVRTAISHTAAVAREQFYKTNDLVKAVQWVSTLDSRTSEICRIRDGLQYTPETHKPIGHQVPWLAGPGRAHWQCRSSSVPITKSWKELGVDIEEFSPSTRASMDGQVPADQTFGLWLKKQSAARQDDILGSTRGKLMRDGGLELDRFYNERGRYLSLQEMAERDAAAFKSAGLPLPA
jgi:SPP1 gp7 family putative phage head morphogenesis protein